MEDKRISYKDVQEALAKDNPYIGVMFEKLNDSMELLWEGHEVMQSRIDRLSEQIEEAEARLNIAEVRSDNAEVKVAHLAVKIDDSSERFGNLAQNIRKKADKEDVVKLSCRITKLEAS